MAEAAPIPMPAADAGAGQPPIFMDSQAPASGEGEVAAAHPLLSASAGPSTSGTATAAPPTAVPSRKEKRAAGAAAKTKPAVASLPSRAEENKYRTKYKQLKVKVQEIEDENAKIQAKILNTKRQIQRLRLERSILYERFVESRGGPLEGTSMAVDSHPPPGSSGDPLSHPSTSGSSALPHAHQHQQDDAFTAAPANGYSDYPASLPYVPPGSSRVIQEASEPSSRVVYQSPRHAGNGYHGIVNDVRTTPHHAMIVPTSVDQQQLPSMVSASASPTHGYVPQMAGSPRQAVQMSPAQHSPMAGVQRDGI